MSRRIGSALMLKFGNNGDLLARFQYLDKPLEGMEMSRRAFSQRQDQKESRHSEQSESQFKALNSYITVDSIVLSEIERLAHATGDLDCRRLSQRFYEHANKAEAAIETGHSHLYRLLGNATSMTLVTKEGNEPFHPLVIDYTKQRRSSALEDFSQDEREVILLLSKQISNLPLKTRLCDLSWVLSRNAAAAQDAITGYLQLFESPDLAIHQKMCYVERALQLARSIRNKKLKEMVRNKINLVIDVPPTEDGLHFYRQWIEIGLKAGITKDIATARAREVAKICCRLQRLDIASELFDVAANTASTAQDRSRLHRRSGIALYLWSKHAASNMQASSVIKQSIEKYRSAPGSRRVVSYMQKKLREKQQDARSYEMGIFTSPGFDVGPHIRAAEDSVRGLPFNEAILRLACIVKLPDPDEMREQAKRKFEISPLLAFCSQEIVDEEGRTISVKPFASLNDNEKNEKVIKFEMYQAAKFSIDYDVRLIDAARRIIMDEHPILRRDLSFLLKENPFIPPGHEPMFLEGLYRGFLGDWVTSNHLLIPQLENSIRYQYDLRGWQIDRLKTDKTQEFLTLQSFLFDRQIESIFNPVIVFNLKCLFADHAGYNMRNSIMHGFWDYWSFHSAPAIYAWWILLHLVCYPILLRSETGKQ